MKIVEVVARQSRSKQSLDRMVEGAAFVLADRGAHGFTIAGVSKQSRVSIGAIYARVGSKDGLIRVVQARALAKMDLEFEAAVNRIRGHSLQLRERVPMLIRELADFHRRHAAILNAFIECGRRDATITALGRKSFSRIAMGFKLLLLDCRDEFHHPAAERAAETCFAVVYGVLARRLGIGETADAETDADIWTRLVDDLGVMTLAFLVVDLHRATRGRGR